MSQDLIKNNKIFQTLIQKQEIVLLLLLIVILLVPLASNFFHQKPLLMGSESYYHLLYEPLSFLLSRIPFSFLFTVPLVLGLVSLLLLFLLARRFNLPPNYSFFFLLFLIFTPAFMYSFSTISAYSFFFFLVLAGFVLLTTQNNIKYLSVIPFIFATFIDIVSAGLLLLLQLLYLWHHKKEKHLTVSLGVTLLSLLYALFFRKIPLALGPFHAEHVALDLVSDLGGLSGIGFILLLLTLIGVGILWRKKEFRVVYLLLFSTILMYLYSTETVLFLATTVVFLAVCGLIALFEQSWNLPTLKRFTFLLILLSVLFSALTYLNRIADLPPAAGDTQALLWMKENTPAEAVVFSAVENGYFIPYFAQREPFQEFHNQAATTGLAGTIMNSTYITTTFPLLEKHNIAYFYITPAMKKQFSADQGLLFLFSNERFKLVYSSQGYEVWEFRAYNSPGEIS